MVIAYIQQWYQNRTDNRLTKAEGTVSGLELEGSALLVFIVLLNYSNKSGSKWTSKASRLAKENKHFSLVSFVRRCYGYLLCRVSEKPIDGSKVSSIFCEHYLISTILKPELNHDFALNASVICFLSVHLIIKISVILFLTIRRRIWIMVAP